MKKVGVLGGMGPDATVLLMQKTIDAVGADDDYHHIPLVVHQNTQVPSRIKAILEGAGEKPTETLKSMAKDLENIGCELLAMPCNTAHYYYSEISKSVNIPLLNMLDLSSIELCTKKIKTVGILASPAVKITRIFEPYFNEYGLTGIFSENDSVILDIIKNIKRGQINSTVINNLNIEAKKVLEKNCDGLLIACTELSLLSGKISGTTIVDTIDCLSKAIVLSALDKPQF